MSFISHTSGIDTTGGSFTLKFKEFPSCDNVRIAPFGKSFDKHVFKIQILTFVHDETLTLIQVSLKTQNLYLGIL